jgi:phosphomethylpyrimidine synthase
MKISQEVREITRLQNQHSDGFILAVAEVYDETGRELYMGAGDRERD